MNEIRDIENLDTDIVIVGSGAAGLTLALRTADFARVTVLSKGDRKGATYYAQGGIAAALDDNDSLTLMLKTPACRSQTCYRDGGAWQNAVLAVARCWRRASFTTNSAPGGLTMTRHSSQGISST